MSGYRIERLPVLTDAQGRPVGMIGGDGREVFLPRFSDDLTALIKPDGSPLAGQGAGYVLPVATSTVLGGVKAGSGIAIDPNGVISTAGGALPTVQATSDDALPARALVYIKSTGNCGLADATAEGKEAIGFVAAAVAAGQVATISLQGSLITGASGLTPGAAQYLSTTPGAFVPSASAPSTTGNVMQKVGVALSSSAMIFAPEPPITL